MTAGQTTRLLLAASIVAVASCSTSSGITTFHDYNPSVDFASYRTWSFMSARPMIVAATTGAVNPLLEDRIMRAIGSEMDRKGFRQVEDPESADVVISFTVGSRDQVRIDQYPASYRMGYGRYHRGYGYGASYGTETRVRQYTEGQLAIDIFDVENHTPAFHGSASKRLTSSDRDNPEALISSVVIEALLGFPPGSARGEALPQLIPLLDPS
jgi:hypothetical protein